MKMKNFKNRVRKLIEEFEKNGLDKKILLQQLKILNTQIMQCKFLCRKKA